MGALLLMLFLPLLAVFTGSTNGLAHAQADPCSAQADAVLAEHAQWNAVYNAHMASENEMERAYASILSTAHELSGLRARISNIDSLLIFIPDPSPHRAQMESMRKGYQDRVRALTQQGTRARSEFLASINDWIKKDDALTAAAGRYNQANDRFQLCRANRSPMPPSPPSGLQGINVRLVGVTTNPKVLKPSGGWTWFAGSMNLTDPSIGHQSFSWTAPPQQIGPEGVQITLTVQSRSNPNGRAGAGLSVRGDFVLTPTPAHVEVTSQNQQLAQNSLTVTLKPPQSFSGRDLYLIIGADYGPISFIYHYEVIR